MADEGLYRVSRSRKAVETLKRLADRISDPARRAELAQIIQAIDDRLRTNPREFGEIYRSRGPIEAYLAVHEVLAVDFAVDQSRKFVLVHSCHALSRYRS
jgi:hypothetical protein